MGHMQNSADPDQTLRNAVSDQGLHYSHKTKWYFSLKWNKIDADYTKHPLIDKRSDPFDEK